MIAIDAPIQLEPSDVSITLKGWVNGPNQPRFVRIRTAGHTVPAGITPAPEVDEHYPDLKAVAYQCSIDFSEVYRRSGAAYTQELFSVIVNVESDQEERGFEYVVPQEWIDRIFEGLASKPKAKPRTPDHLMIRVSGSSDISFYATGHIATRQIRDLLHEVGKDLNDFHTILDFGCGCARVLMAFFHEGVNAEFYGSDIDEEAMLWAQKNFAPAARFNANGVLPPTRHESNMFDFVYAISVFTHLPEDHQDAWLSELARILKPGGVLITTVHGPRTQSFLPPEVRAAVERKGFLYVDQTNKDWPSYLGAKTDGLPDFYRLSYHTFDYVRTKWSKYFDILTIKEQGLNFLQDAVVCQKR